MNTGASWPNLDEARSRVLGIQTKLHRWATDGRDRRFDDLYNLVGDPAFLVVAWDRVRGNRGARTAGVDGIAPNAIATDDGGDVLLRELRDDLKQRRFVPLPVRERLIPKAPGKVRRLGIPTARDRVVQASLKLVLEPIFEADFRPCSYGFRPKRRAQDAIEEIRHFSRLTYEWVLEGDIESCFDEISHSALMDRVRMRISDKRVLSLVKAFLACGILSADGQYRGAKSGTPQGGILSPLLANIALSTLDDWFASAWQTSMAASHQRERRRRRGEPMYRLVRYADDFVVLVSGTKAHADGLRGDVAAALAPIGLRLSDAKTQVCHIDEGFDFLGFRIQRQVKRGTTKAYVYTWPSKKALASIMATVKVLCRQTISEPLCTLLRRLNSALQGWTAYFRHGVSNRTFDYLNHYTWQRVIGWLRRKHARAKWSALRRRYLGHQLVPEDDGIRLFNPASVPIVRYRYRGAQILTPWTKRPTTITTAELFGPVESRMR